MKPTRERAFCLNIDISSLQRSYGYATSKCAKTDKGITIFQIYLFLAYKTTMPNNMGILH